MTTICALSDLHGYLPVAVPESDILVVAGDISPIRYDRDTDRCTSWIRNEFSDWTMKRPAKHRLVIAGNHDFALENRYAVFGDAKDTTYDVGWTYLEDEAIIVDDIRFYGIPWVPNLKGWAFYGDNATLSEKYKAVDTDTDVVITHGPPYGVADKVISALHPHVGSAQCDMMIRDIKPKHVICGHIHEGFGHYELGETEVWNVAIMDARYQPLNSPVMIEV